MTYPTTAPPLVQAGTLSAGQQVSTEDGRRLIVHNLSANHVLCFNLSTGRPVTLPRSEFVQPVAGLKRARLSTINPKDAYTIYVLGSLFILIDYPRRDGAPHWLLNLLTAETIAVYEDHEAVILQSQ